MISRTQSCLENLDRFDMNHYEDTLMENPKFRQMETEGSSILPSFPALQRDVWGSLYKYSPKITPVLNDKELTINKEILQKLVSNPEYQGMREYTKLDDLASALGTISMSDRLTTIIQNIDERSKDLHDRMQEAQKKADEKKDEQDALKQHIENMLQQMEQINHTGNTQPQEELKNKIQEAEKKEKAAGSTFKKFEKQANQMQQELQGAIQQAMGNSQVGHQITSAVQQAFNETKDLTEEVNSLTSDAWGSGHGSQSKADLLAKLQIAEVLKANPQLRRTLSLAGKMKNIAMKKQKEKTTLTTLKQEISMGNNLDRLLPTELMLYHNPSTKNQFMQKYAEGQCLQYSTKAREKMGKGPVVCCIDESGSMKDILIRDEKRSEWAKSVAFALWTIAQKQKRSFYMIEFDDVVHNSMKVTKNTDDLVRLLNIRSRGGTSFEAPLKESFEVIKKEKEFKHADIIFITDGTCYISDDYLINLMEDKKKTKTAIYSIQLSSTDKCDVLKKFSDHLIRFDGSDNFTKVFEI